MDLSALRRLVTCAKCENFLNEPIILPCCNYMCESHLDELKSKDMPTLIKCVCKHTHQIPDNGFERSDNLNDVIKSSVHLYDEERESISYFENSLNNLEKLTELLETKHPETEIFIFNLIAKIKNQIDLDVEKLKSRIDDLATKLFEKIKSFEKKCYDTLSSIEKIENFTEFLSEFKQRVNIHKRSTNWSKKHEKSALLKVDLENKIKKVEAKLREFECVKSSVKRLIYKPLKESFFAETQFLGELEDVKKFKLFTGSWDNTLNLYESDAKVQKIEEHDGGILSLALNATKRLLISGYACGEIKIWSVKNNFNCVKKLTTHSSLKGVFSLLVGPSGELLSGFGDGTIKIWNLETWECFKTFKEHFHTVYSIISLNDGQYASRSKDKTIKIWNLSGIVSKTIKIDSSVNCNIVSNSSQSIVTGESNGSIKIWDLVEQTWIKTLIGHKSYIYSLEVTESGILLSGYVNFFFGNFVI